MTTRMEAPVRRTGEPAAFAVNLAALQARLPQTYRALQLPAARGPQSLQETIGRDAAPTYRWRDADGAWQWLGRTTMPTVRAPALVDAFDDAGGNALIVGIGQGAEIRCLLDRLAPHQAVMVIEPCAWHAALVLRLYDFRADISGGRLLLFAGDDAWDRFADFLTEHEGYLEPLRILAWPWFDAAEIDRISRKLTETNARVGSHRTARRQELTTALQSSLPTDPEKISLAITGDGRRPSTKAQASALVAAASADDYSPVTLLRDAPAEMHPLFLERRLAAARPSCILILDDGPAASACRLPPVPVVSIWTRESEPTPEFFRAAAASKAIFVKGPAQRDALIALGAEPSRIALLPPAARSDVAAPGPSTSSRILVVADGADPDAQAAGVHLASHLKLWEAASAVLRDRCADYVDDDARRIVFEAERRLDVPLSDNDVRDGLAARLAAHLAPAVIRSTYLHALLDAGIEFDLFGDEWKHDDALARRNRGSWPPTGDAAAWFAGYGAMVIIEPSGRVPPVVMDAAAAGLALFIRRHPRDETENGLAAVFDPAEHVNRFAAPQELINMLRRLTRDPGAFADRAAQARRHVSARHTWSHRLERILAAAGLRTG